MRKIIVTLIIVFAAITVYGDGITINQLRRAAAQARIKTNESLRRGKKLYKDNSPMMLHLRRAGKRARK